MSTLSDRLYAQARIVPIRKQNQVKSIEKQTDGALRVCTQGGDSYYIPAHDTELQAFAVYTVLQDAAGA